MKLSCLAKEDITADDFEGGVGFQVGPLITQRDEVLFAVEDIMRALCYLAMRVEHHGHVNGLKTN